MQRRAGNNAVSALVGGMPMENGLRTEMEARFGADFGDVRIHDDAQAHDGAAARSAKAYTSGAHIVFGHDRYDPQAGEGRRLLAHELAHVVQQRRGGTTPPRQDGHGSLETAAQQAAQGVVAGSGIVDVAGASAPGIACEPEDEKKKKKPTDPEVEKAFAEWQQFDKEEGGTPKPPPGMELGKPYNPPPPDARRLKSQELHKKRQEQQAKKAAGQQQTGDTDASKASSPPRVPAKLRKQLNEEKEAGRAIDALKHDALVRAQDPMTHEDMLNKIVAWRAVESSVGVGALDDKRAAYREAQLAADAHPGNPELAKLRADTAALDKAMGPLERRQAKETLTPDEQIQLETLQKKRADLRQVINEHPATVAHNKANALYGKLAVSTFEDPADPEKESPGALAGRGEHTYVIIQVIGQDGKLLAVGRGRNASGLHAEDVALEEIAAQVGDLKKLAGTRLEVVGDQVVCDDKCFITLGKYKKEHGLSSVRAVVFRELGPEGTEKAPRTTAQGATLRKSPGTLLVKEIEEIDSSVDVKQRSSQRQKSPPQPAAVAVKSPGGVKQPPAATAPAVVNPITNATPEVESAPVEPAQTETEDPEKQAQKGGPKPLTAGTPVKKAAVAGVLPVVTPTEQEQQEPKPTVKPAAKKKQAPQSETAAGAPHADAPAREETPRGGLKGTRSVHTEYGERVTVSVEEIVGATDKPFRVTTTISLNLGAGGTAEYEKGGASASGNVSASARLSISFSRMMSAAEKDQHQRAIGAPPHGSTATELQLVELIASGQDGEAARMLERVRDAYRSGAKTTQRSEGEYIEIDVEGDIGAGGGAGGGGISAHAQRTVGAGLRQRVMFTGGKESITITTVNRSSTSIGGAASIVGAGAGYTGHEGIVGDTSIEFRLDPEWKDYQQIRREILDARSFDDVRSIAAAHPDHPTLVSGRTQSTEQSTGSETDFTVFGFGLGFKKAGTVGEGTEQRGSETFRNVSGSGTAGVALIGAGKQVQPFSKTDSLRGRVGPGNTGEAVTQSESTHLDLAKSASQLGSQLQAHPLSTVASVVRGNKKILQNRVETTGKVLSDASIARIAVLADDKDQWLRAWNYSGVTRGAYEEWERTRQNVRAAKGDRYAILKALAQWEAGDSGRSGDVERLAGATGAAFQFSDENADQKAVYESLVAQDPTGHARQLAASGDTSAALKELQALHDRLGQLAQNIQQHEQGATPGRLDEMLRLIYARRDSIRSDMAALGGPASEQTGAPATDPGAERSQIGQRIRDLTALCVTNRYKEREVFARIERKLDTSYLSSLEYADVRTAFNSLEPVYAQWDKAIEEIKTLRSKLGLAPEAATELAPDRERLKALSSDRKLRRIQG